MLISPQRVAPATRAMWRLTVVPPRTRIGQRRLITATQVGHDRDCRGARRRVDVAADPESGGRQQVSRQGFRTKAQAIDAMRMVQAEIEPSHIRPADPLSVRQVARSCLDRKVLECQRVR